MKRKSTNFLLFFFLSTSIFLCVSTSLFSDPIKKPKKPSSTGFDTCYYFLSGFGLEPIGATVLNLKTIDCRCNKDSVDIILNEELKIKYPDDFFMLEQRKVNGPYKKLIDAETEILKIKNVIK